jgi:hypothetical protein
MRTLITATAVALGSLALLPAEAQAWTWGRFYGTGYVTSSDAPPSYSYSTAPAGTGYVYYPGYNQYYLTPTYNYLGYNAWYPSYDASYYYNRGYVIGPYGSAVPGYNNYYYPRGTTIAPYGMAVPGNYSQGTTYPGYYQRR